MKKILVFIPILIIGCSGPAAREEGKPLTEKVMSGLGGPMDTAKFAGIRGKYYNGNDGVIRIFTKDNHLYLKYLRGKEPFELFSITDSTYISHDTGHGGLPLQFRRNPTDGKLNIVFIEEGKAYSYEHPMKADDEKVPYEYLLEGEFNKAVKGYQVIQKENPKNSSINEGTLNNQGYDLMNQGKMELAKDVLKINTILYPNSANAYNSYAEACMKNGEKELAIANYKKSLALNPENKNAVKMLAELQAK